MKKIKMMPDVVIPEGIVNQSTGEARDMPFDMVKFLNTCLNRHEKFGKGLDGVSQGLKIKETYEKAKTSFQLEDADYAELKKAVNGASMAPMVGMACKIYYEAIEDAVDVEVPAAKTKSIKGKKTK